MKPFTVKQIEALKPKDKPYRISSGKGFYIRVMPSGQKRWELVYKIKGRTRVLHLGNYPTISLSDASTKFWEARRLLDQGEDPGSSLSPPLPPTDASEVSESTTVEAKTISDLVDLWINWSSENHDDKWHNTLKLTLNKDFLPIYGKWLIKDFSRKHAMAVIEKKATDAPGQARNLLKALRGTWDYAVIHELAEYNPFKDLKAAKQIPSMAQESGERHLSDDEIRHVWHSILSIGGSESTKRALLLTLITGQRCGEVCGMKVNELMIDYDTETGWWTIPKARRMGKKGGTHRVFLTRLAVSVIMGNQDRSSVGNKYGLICPGKDQKYPIQENSVANYVRSIAPKNGKTKYYGLPEWSPHDLRRTAGTGVRRLGASRDDMDLILGHKVGGVTGVYDLWAGDPEKEKWLTRWSEHLQEVVKSIITSATGQDGLLSTLKWDYNAKRSNTPV
ncbi:site-specific integrase [Oryzomonas sagensis]|uniref:Site-specific integrase n=1 Tax=Oryzomonas sagensis TaxID=2603857 RepID=A0ABQ6TLA2_9BACT|nr:site-specific integrase [Oryzomonas sagensis]KAB0669052.1 site-specific integrase [Oryzomonas sagensis]